MTSIVLAEHWRRYHDGRERTVRDELVLAYAPIVKYAAGKIAARMPAHVDVADLISYGLGGLIEAVERFDPAQGQRFESFAGLRIRGAIIDALRSLDWVPRAVRAEARQIDAALLALTTRLQRVPTDVELGASLGLAPDELDDALQRIGESRMIALDQPWGAPGIDGPRPSLGDQLADDGGSDPEQRALAGDERERIATALEGLESRDQVVLGLRYHQDMTLGEIGEILGLSDSRVCQIHAGAVLRLGGLLAGSAA
ncbi:FliA/WhiG family RNA polymerase sigma factor [Baekduia soli]|uniref:FliA/WhiG family RNA polymerase sigma factor n=1 Tax=Baekduia soli TaxID=496014 RepID=A0A5B8U4N8_9ACTN|nr:FliA/WhiG family RNA polymerase sigma factor [Baekduia soli]QEC47937.1 FliA/WhiG family RNA polymerase sigma factor [Baekduia soli]